MIVKRYQSDVYASATGGDAHNLWTLNVYRMPGAAGQTQIDFFRCEYPNGDTSYYTCYALDGFVAAPLVQKGLGVTTLNISNAATVSAAPDLPLFRSAFQVDCRTGNCYPNEIQFPSVSISGVWKADTSQAFFGYISETTSGITERIVPTANGEQITRVTGTRKKTGVTFTGTFGTWALNSAQGEMVSAKGSQLVVEYTRTQK